MEERAHPAPAVAPARARIIVIDGLTGCARLL
jgi:hypothetical protein